MKDSFAGKLCLVTGAAQGIGKAVAEIYARRGARLALIDLKKDALETTAAEIARRHGVQPARYVLDVSDFDAVRKTMQRIGDELGAINILANCAGISTAGLLRDIGERAWDRVMNINLKSVYLLSTLAADNMVANSIENGRIVSISSQASKIAELGNGAYSIAKAGVNSMTQVLGLELARYGISVTAVCPGYVDTEIMQKVFRERGPIEGMTPAEYEKSLTDQVPIGRMSSPEEIAEFIAFLSSDKAGSITGVALTIAGGRMLI